MSIRVTATMGGIRPLPSPPTPPANRPDEFWWIEWSEGMPLQPACISFDGDVPAKVQQLGDDSWGGTPISETDVRLVAPVIPHAPGQVVISREEFETLWNGLIHHYDAGVAYVAAMRTTWDSLRPFIDAERFAQTRTFLGIQHREAKWWRDASIAYFQSISKRPLPADAAAPDHDLNWYKSLNFPYAPGNP